MHDFREAEASPSVSRLTDAERPPAGKFAGGKPLLIDEINHFSIASGSEERYGLHSASPTIEEVSHEPT